MATLTRHFTAVDPDPDEAVTKANAWMGKQTGYGLAKDHCKVQYANSLWMVTAFLRDDRSPQEFNHTTDDAKWNFGVGKNLFNYAFSNAISVNGTMHYFGSRW